MEYDVPHLDERLGARHDRRLRYFRGLLRFGCDEDAELLNLLKRDLAACDGRKCADGGPKRTRGIEHRERVAGDGRLSRVTDE